MIDRFNIDVHENHERHVPRMFVDALAIKCHSYFACELSYLNFVPCGNILARHFPYEPVKQARQVLPREGLGEHKGVSSLTLFAENGNG